jgi:hypothetical protein
MRFIYSRKLFTHTNTQANSNDILMYFFVYVLQNIVKLGEDNLNLIISDDKLSQCF